MSVEKFSFQKALPIIVIAWILSLVTTLALVYVVVPSVIPTIDTERLADGAVITTKLADGSVTSAKILDGTITGEDIDDGEIITVKISNGAITAAKMADGAVTSEKLATGAVVTVNLADASVTSSKLADGSVITVKMADGSVTTAKILDGTIATADLATGAVTAVKIADGAITTAKIADGAVTNIKFASQAIPFNSTHAGPSDASTTSTSWVDMSGMAVNITLTRTSHVLIMFSAEARLSAPGNYLMIRAYVGTTLAYPDTNNIYLTRADAEYGSNSYVFYAPDVSAGTYTVKMQWEVWLAGDTGYVGDRTLTAIALPA